MAIDLHVTATGIAKIELKSRFEVEANDRVGEWVVVDGLTADPVAPGEISFAITVSGRPLRTATLFLTRSR